MHNHKEHQSGYILRSILPPAEVKGNEPVGFNSTQPFINLQTFICKKHEFIVRSNELQLKKSSESLHLCAECYETL